MVNSRGSGSQSSPTWIVLVAIVFWLFFMGGLSTVKQWSAGRAPSDVASTISRGVDRVVAPAALPTRQPAPAAVQPPAPAAAPAVDVSAAIDAYNAAQQAAAPAAAAPVAQPAAPVAAVQPAVDNPATWPTAAIVVPTVLPATQVVVVPDPNKRVVYTSSGPAPTAAAPTLPIPTPIAANDVNMVVSPDGKCVTATRRNSGGKRYQTCQEWGYKDYEARSTAELLYTGLITGVEVQ